METLHLTFVIALLTAQALLFGFVVRELRLRLIEVMALFIGVSLSLAISTRWLGTTRSTDVVLTVATLPICLVLFGSAWGIGVANARQIHSNARRVGLMFLGSLMLPSIAYFPFGAAVLALALIDPQGAQFWLHGVGVLASGITALFALELHFDTVHGHGLFGSRRWSLIGRASS